MYLLTYLPTSRLLFYLSHTGLLSPHLSTPWPAFSLDLYHYTRITQTQTPFSFKHTSFPYIQPKVSNQRGTAQHEKLSPK